ncbi:hypothetical protein [Thalassomonas haliotis]|uniref:Cytochrome c domain-containing protein n=1 Tax=Thalassomonas haliotis TaxID=485448 RepID=A0ABY7V9E4_9GAMM|nr:hypothetical protein [Thalassomonas haliotis]WDE10217.1 hypothetical protein H3N35_18290 [Thalassomonas haliotis]
MKRFLARSNFFVVFFLVIQGCSEAPCGKGIGKTLDEAKCVGREADSLPGADEDYYADMDYGVSKDPALIQSRLAPYVPGITNGQAVDAFVKGRNNWIVWTAGNDTLWDELSKASVGNLDFLKTLSSHPSLTKYSRDNRWSYFGLVNEPCFKKATGPRADRYGLWLDERAEGCAPDPFENEEKYPGIKIGARGDNMPLGSYYGYGTGVIGLRLFPNPAFDSEAEKKWDPERYYNDPGYYLSKDLVKPYRVGMSCGFCHVGPNPSNPPADHENPEWANLNSNPGAQYFWIDRIFMWGADASNFAYQLFHTSRPGALDTSFVSTDYINNPRTMNAIYNLGARMELAARFGKEKLSGGSSNNAQLNDYVPADTPLTQFYQEPDTVFTPRVLKDGADSVGALGALNRVYLNIGLFSDEWLQHFMPLVGGKKISPIKIADARKNSSFWNANEAQTPDLALFFLASATPDYLKNAPGGESYLTATEEEMNNGKNVFADTCARCHSSKFPDKTISFFPDKGCNNDNYLACWNQYWDWTQTDEFKHQMRKIVNEADFLDNNFLSTEMRIPVSQLETNACSPLATNALEDNIWDNFSSETYKNLPSVGAIEIQHPYSGAVSKYEMPGSGRGYTRPASLVSLWSTAPFLLNNTLGRFEYSGTVQDRMKAFDDAIEQLLWPEKRDGDFTVVTKSGLEHPGIIDRTTEQSYLRVSSGYLPGFLQALEGTLADLLPWLFSGEGIEIGPIPSGTPVSMLSNLDLEQRKKVLKLLLRIKKDLKALPKGASDEQAREVFKNLVDPLIDASKCPDYVVNKGHYFGTQYDKNAVALSNKQKQDLIKFLKTF